MLAIISGPTLSAGSGEGGREGAGGEGGTTQFDCITSTKVQILTEKEQAVVEQRVELVCCIFVGVSMCPSTWRRCASSCAPS